MLSPFSGISGVGIVPAGGLIAKKSEGQACCTRRDDPSPLGVVYKRGCLAPLVTVASGPSSREKRNEASGASEACPFVRFPLSALESLFSGPPVND